MERLMGTELEYIKAGKYTIPVELSIVVPDDEFEFDDRIWEDPPPESTKVINKESWTEMKNLLKIAVVTACKYNEEADLSKLPAPEILPSGNFVILGFSILSNDANQATNACRAYLDVKKNDNPNNIASGGSFEEYTPTRVFIRAIASFRRKNESSEFSEHTRIIRDELGIKKEENLRNYITTGLAETKIE